MRRGRVAVVVSLKTSVIGSCPASLALAGTSPSLPLWYSGILWASEGTHPPNGCAGLLQSARNLLSFAHTPGPVCVASSHVRSKHRARCGRASSRCAARSGRAPLPRSLRSRPTSPSVGGGAPPSPIPAHPRSLQAPRTTPDHPGPPPVTPGHPRSPLVTPGHPGSPPETAPPRSPTSPPLVQTDHTWSAVSVFQWS